MEGRGGWESHRKTGKEGRETEGRPWRRTPQPREDGKAIGEKGDGEAGKEDALESKESIGKLPGESNKTQERLKTQRKRKYSEEREKIAGRRKRRENMEREASNKPRLPKML
eukprot:Gb_26312 [translate_table: standard]